MNSIYEASHRRLQDRFDSRRLADRLAEVTLHSEFTDTDKAFIESRDMFFLATVDADGRPSCSYKGGDPGFIRVIDATTLAFPNYNGNGMFLSMGNMSARPEVGLLFIDFETPNRLRMQGTAEVLDEDPLLADFAGAELIIRVKATAIWPNCPRYIHRYQKVSRSRYVPAAGCKPPLAEWKRIDLVRDAMPRSEEAEVKSVPPLTAEEWTEKMHRGEG